MPAGPADVRPLLRILLADPCCAPGKILVGFYQLITKVDNVYRIMLPADVRQLTSIFSVGVSFGLGSTDSVLTCLQLDGYLNQVHDGTNTKPRV